MKNELKTKLLHWKDYVINLNNKIFLNNSVIKKYINIFWKININITDNKNNHILMLFRIKLENGDYATIGQLQRLNVEDKDYLIEYLQNILALKQDSYRSTGIIEIIFSYGFRLGRLPEKQKFNKEVNYQRYNGYKIPTTMDPIKYGKLITKINNKCFIQINQKNMVIVETNIDKNSIQTNKVQLLSAGNLVLDFVDISINDKLFKRTIGKYEYFVENDELKLTLINKKYKNIEKAKPNKNINEKFLTLDIETKLTNNIHIPYCVSIFNGINHKSFYLTDFSNHKDMLIAAIKTILIPEYNGYHVYLHNFANFDGIFLFNVISELGNANPIFRDGNLISVKLNFKAKDDICNITFNDSYLLLLNSLKNLAKSFQLDIGKTIFPYDFVNNVSNLDYIGKVPSFNYFSNISKFEYSEYCEKFKLSNTKKAKKQKMKEWSLREETIKYCENDTTVLYNIIHSFNEIIFNLFQININNHPTLPSLAFRIFITCFIKESKDVLEITEKGYNEKLTTKNIPQLSGQTYKDIKLGYTGGAVDVYVPETESGKLAYYYDFNSLYPSVMAKYEMPIGKCTFFKGDIRKYQPDAFGFFFCKVKTPMNLKYPILQTHVKTKEGIRTISALGTYEDMLFSAEMDNALKFGYEFEILWGYTFQKAIIFDEFISQLYNIRLSYPKSDPMNLVAKIIMNSLYGRFGMKDDFSDYILVDKEKYLDFENKYEDSIIDIKELDNKFMFEIKSPEESRNTMLNSESGTSIHRVNIAIASAITSYARIEMANLIKYLLDNNYILYYKDTDSIVVNKPLPDSLVSNTKLGQLKLEYIIKKGIFLAPKVYSLLTLNDEFISKAKGLTNKVALSLSDFESLLYKDSKLEKSQEKWFKSLNNSSISIKKQIYTLKVTGNKRILVYDLNNKFIDTKPFVINSEKNIL